MNESNVCIGGDGGPLNIQDTMLRLQVGADSSDPKYFYSILDVPTIPGVKRCDVYSMKYSDWRGEIVIIKSE